MKSLKFTLLTLTLAFLVHAAFAQNMDMTGNKVLVTDGTMMVTDSTAQDLQVPHNVNAVLELKSGTKPLILPVIPYDKYLNITPAPGMICVTTGVTGYDDPAFHNLEFYMDEPGTGDDAWVRVITSKNSLSALYDVKRTGRVNTLLTSYYIGERAGFKAESSKRFNTMVGFDAGYNSEGESNTLLGYNSGYELTSATQNTALGVDAGRNVSTGDLNTFVGFNAWADDTGDGSIIGSTAVGSGSKTKGNESTALGFQATTNGFHSTAIGAGAVTTGANQIMLGTASETVVVPGVLNTQGAVYKNVKTLTVIANAYTVVDTDYTVRVQNSGGNIAVTIPDPNAHIGRVLIIKNDGGASITTLTAASGTIDGGTVVLNGAHKYAVIQSLNVSEWIVIGGNF